MAQKAEQFDARKALLRVLLTKVQKDRFPSSTMMNMIEQLMGPDEQSIYAQLPHDAAGHFAGLSQADSPALSGVSLVGSAPIADERSPSKGKGMCRKHLPPVVHAASARCT